MISERFSSIGRIKKKAAKTPLDSTSLLYSTARVIGTEPTVADLINATPELRRHHSPEAVDKILGLAALSLSLGLALYLVKNQHSNAESLKTLTELAVSQNKDQERGLRPYIARRRLKKAMGKSAQLLLVDKEPLYEKFTTLSAAVITTPSPSKTLLDATNEVASKFTETASTETTDVTLNTTLKVVDIIENGDAQSYPEALYNLNGRQLDDIIKDLQAQKVPLGVNEQDWIAYTKRPVGNQDAVKVDMAALLQD
jgi:hypothetical protein